MHRAVMSYKLGIPIIRPVQETGFFMSSHEDVREQLFLDVGQTIIISKSNRLGIDITVFTLKAILQQD